MSETVYAVGELVKKVGGDYAFEGEVVAAFVKRSGSRRYVVEDDRGVLHVYSAKNLETRDESPSKPPEKDVARLEWVLPIVTGTDDAVSNTRAIALVGALMAGLSGRAAIDHAMNPTTNQSAS